ncbi:hypothetical protein E2986_12849 [Frieseomelitta varia]|uniref:Heme-copper oxidase subunit III family profile domain-containing protein n=1 Tax=Frieseomelitta varia TaxID=561572 RepID=A0A833RW87_9HYME|nr:hypothetical protein E2986_12849 [Frieseomelitta varia]
MEIPLLNTFTLITSGFYITLSHLYFLNNFFSSTILIDLYFSIIQIFEYKNAYFYINDRIYGSIFFFFYQLDNSWNSRIINYFVNSNILFSFFFNSSY